MLRTAATSDVLNRAFVPPTRTLSELDQRCGRSRFDIADEEHSGNGSSDFRIPPLGAARDAAAPRCMNDLPIREGDRAYFWPLGRRPDDLRPLRARFLRGVPPPGIATGQAPQRPAVRVPFERNSSAWSATNSRTLLAGCPVTICTSRVSRS